MNENLNICVAQIDVEAGNPLKNEITIINAINKACFENADLIIFPEMSIPGYLVGDNWERESFIKTCLNVEKRIVDAFRNKNITIVLGNVSADFDEKNEDGRIRKYNAAKIIQKGNVQTAIKTLQPNYREFDDNRYFYDKRKLIMDRYLMLDPQRDVNINDFIKMSYVEHSFSVNGINLFVMLCEDGWQKDYSMSPIDFIGNDTDIIINISCSPYTKGKSLKRNRVFGNNALNENIPIIYVNNVGIQNNGKTIYTFDGDSGLYDVDGMFYRFYEPFKESVCTFNISVKNAHYEENIRINHVGDDSDDIEKLYNSIKYGVEKFINKLGIKKIVIGASGGIDSAVVASIISKILDPKDIYLINMPSKFNSNTTKNLAEQLAKNIGCNYSVVPIENSIQLTYKQLKDNGFEISDFVMENIQARDRSSRVLAAIAASVGGVFTCNANKSETTVGYTTLYGDLGGFMAPLADVWKTDVYKLAKYINENFDEIIPEGSIDIKPSAELSSDQNVDNDKGDPIIYEYHDLLFKSWVERWDRLTPSDILNLVKFNQLEFELGFKGNIIKDIFNNDINAFIDDLERWWKLYDGFSIAKRIQAPPILAISRRSFGFDHRESQMKPFFGDDYLLLKNQLLGNCEYIY